VTLVVSQLARRDLNSISRYTLDNWGRKQLLAYVGGLLDQLDEIAENPKQGRNAARIPVHFLRAQYRSHFIFYRIVGNDVHVIRILHQSMDAARHLN
jgi:toxin ParE1/3/4